MKRSIWLYLLFFCWLSSSAISQQPFVLSMQTAETLGKGGYATNIEVIRYERTISTSNQSVVIGNFFQEKHDVTLKADKLLFPVILTFGIGESLDLSIGGTPSSGEMQKSITDYYEVGDELRARVYSQPMFDGKLGLKYNIKPDIGDGMPAVSIGGALYTGYTADDQLEGNTHFLDDTPVDGFPFTAARLYMVGSQSFAPLAKVHAGFGGLLSQKRFRFAFQLGADLAMTDQLSAVADYSTVRLVSGVEINSVFNFGMRYELSSRRHFYAALSTVDFTDLGLLFGFTLVVEKIPLASPVGPPPASPEDLF